MNLKEIGINTRNWIDWAQDRDYCRGLVNAKLNLWFRKAWILFIMITIINITISRNTPLRTMACQPSGDLMSAWAEVKYYSTKPFRSYVTSCMKQLVYQIFQYQI